MTPITLPRITDDDANDGFVSRFDVERLATGELTGADKARVEAAVAADPALKAFFDDVVASDRAFLIAHPPGAFFATASSAAPTFADKLRAFFKSPQLVSSLCAAAAVVVIVNAPIGGDGRERIKGGEQQPAVSFFVQEGETARLGHAGDTLRAGDKIQLAVKDVDKRAMVVVGVDGSGAVSVYAREAVSGTTKGAQKPRLLPASLLLDETTGPERFFVVYGDELQATEDAARRAADRLGQRIKDGRANLVDEDHLAIDAPGMAQASVHIVKVR